MNNILESILGLVGKNKTDFHIYHTQRVIENNTNFEIIVVFVDNTYNALIINDFGIVIKELYKARNLGNLYQLLYDLTKIDEYSIMVEEIYLNEIGE